MQEFYQIENTLCISGKSLLYLPKEQQFITVDGKKSKLMDKNLQKIKECDLSSQKLDSIESSNNIIYDNQILRFSVENSSDKVQISSNGFMATCFTDGGNLLVTNKGFSEGEHYWELITPINCNGMLMGIVEEGVKTVEYNSNKEVQKMIVQSFRTTTPRTIGIKLNFKNLTLQYWLNDNFQSTRTKQIKNNVKYYPCVLFTNTRVPPIGSQIILNPFVIDIEKNILQFYSKEMNISNDQQNDEVMSKLNNIYNQIRNNQFTNINNYEDLPQDVQFYYVKSDKNLIIRQDDKIKLVRKNNQNNFEINSKIFLNKPFNLQDMVYLQISQKNLNYLLVNCMIDIQNEIILGFLDSILNFLEIDKKVYSTQEIVILEISFKSAYDAIQYMINYTVHSQNINQIALYILINLDEQLYQMIQHPNISDDFYPLYQNSNRCFSAFNRLQSFMNYCPNPYDQFQLAEQGLINTQDLLNNLKHFLNLNQEIESLSLLNNKEKPLLQQLKNQLPQNQMLQGLPTPNVPLSLSINSLPFIQVNDLQTILSSSSSDFIVTVDKKCQVQIFDTQLCLNILCQNNFKDKQYKKQKVELIDEKEPIFHQLINEDFFDIQETAVDEQKQNDEVIPDMNLVDQLSIMGYSIEVCKQALKMVKNSGIEEAIDVIPKIIENIEKEKKNEKQVETLNQTWECPDCTFLNQNFNPFCDVCERSAPLSAYSVNRKESLRKQSNNSINDQQVQLQIQQQNDQKKQEKKQNKLDFLQNSIMVGQFMFQSKVSKRYPLNIGIILQKDQQVKIRIRRFGYSSSYLAQYYTFVQKNNICEYICNLYGRVQQVKQGNNKDLEDFLFSQESKNSIEVLGSIFIENKQPIFEQLENFDINLEAQKILDYKIQQYDESVNEKYYLYILVNQDDNFYLLQYDLQIYNFSYDTLKNIKCQILNKFHLEEMDFQGMAQMVIQKDYIEIFNQKKVFYIKNGVIEYYKHLDFTFSQIQESYNGINIYFGIKDDQNVIILNKKLFQQEKLLIDQNLEEPQQQDINQDLMNYIKKIIQHKYISSNSNSQIQSNLDENNCYTKHYWIFDNQNYIIEFDQPQCIIGANINLHSDEYTFEIQKQDPKSYIQTNNLYIPLRVASFTGAQYNSQTQVCNLVYPKDQFISNYPNTKYIFENLHKKQMLISSVKIISQEKPQNGGYPIGTGLIFTSNCLNQAFNIDKFLKMSPQQYKAWQITKQGQEYQPNEPVGCFSEDKMHFELDVKRPCKYIILLPTNSRRIPNDYTKNFSSSSIEIQFFGVQGIILDDDNEMFQLKKFQTENQKLQEILNVEFYANEQWHIIQDYQQISQNELSILNNKDLYVQKIRFQINQNFDQKLKGVSIQAYSNKYSKSQYQQFIKQLDDYNSFYQKIVNQMTNEQQQIRQNSIKLMNQILITMPQNLKNVFDDLNFEKFIEMNLFQQDGSYLIEVKNFFNYLINNQEIYDKILIYLKTSLKNIENFKMTLQGFQGFMVILNFFSQDMEDDILQKIHVVALNLMNQKKGEYNILRSQFNLPCLSFEKQLFSNQNINLVENVQQQLEQKQNFIQSKFITTSTFCGYEILINLQQTYNIKEILLSIEGNQSDKEISKIIQKMNLQIYEVIPKDQSYTKKLIHNEKLQNSIFYQLSQLAQDKTKYEDYFEEIQNLGCLGIGNIDIQAQYLIIQISYQLQPHLQTIEEKIPPNLILPLIKGEISAQQCPQIKEIDILFDNITSKKNIITQSNKQKFIQQIISTNKFMYQNETNNNGKQQIQLDEKEILQNQLENQQNQLTILLTNNRDNLNQQVVIDICKSIEEIQIKLFTNEPQDIRNNLDFQYTLANELSFFLRKCYKQKKSQYKNSVLQIILDIFQAFIVFESNFKSNQKKLIETSISQNYINLINEFFKKSLSERQYLYLIIQIINRFLIKPINQKDCDIKNLFSQLRVIDALNEIQIPNEEILSFIASKLGIQYNNQGIKFNKQFMNNENQREQIFSLTCILNLLIKGFQHLTQDQTFDPVKIYHKQVYCIYCQKDKVKCIEGCRLKCLNCINTNICSQKQCFEQHMASYPNHSFIYIEEPLPLIPNKIDHKQIQFQPFQQCLPLTKNHGIPCQICQINIQSQGRMMCANCQSYDICYGCYNLNKAGKHNKNHVFIRLDYKIVNQQKQVFQTLDPMLYPFKPQSEQQFKKQRAISIHCQEDLEPLKIKRYYSHQLNQAQFLKNQLQKQNLLVMDQENELFKLPKLDYQQSFLVTFGICLWICDNNQLCENDKRNILSLCFKLLNSIMLLTSPEGIREILKNQNYFLTLIFNIWKYGSSNEIEQLKNFLKNLVQQLTENQKQNLDNQIKNEIKNLTLYHFQTFQNWLLEFPIKNQQFSLYTSLFGSNISPNIWIQHLTFSLEFLLDCSDDVQLQKNNVSDLIPLGISKSLSYQQDCEQKIQQVNVEDQMFTMNTVNNLLKLMTPTTQKIKQNFTFQTTAKLWQLTLRTIQKFQIQQLIENKIYEQIIQCFFQSDYEIQSMVATKILSFTNNLVQKSNSQKEICSLILDQFFISFDLQNSKYDHIKFQLLKGWMDILLYLQQTKTQSKQIYCKLNLSGTLNLLSNISYYLKNQINYGGKDGVEMASIINVLKLELADDLFKILLNSESGPNFLSINELFQNCSKYQNVIKQSIARLIEWYLLNKNADNQISPSTILLKSISDQVYQVFNIIKEHQDVTKISISCLINSCKNQDQIVNNLMQNNQIPGFVANKLNKQWCETMEKLYSIWVSCDSTALHAAFTTQGLEFLLDKIGVQNNLDKQSLLQGTDLEWKSEKQIEEKEFIFQEEEFANVVTIVNLPNQNIINYPPDWSNYKKGNKSKLFVIDMINTFYTEYELIIQLSHPIQLKNLSMGFNSSSVEFQQKILGVPSSILLEGSLNTTQFQPLGVLKPIADYGYSLYSVEVFRKNFQKISKDNNQKTSNLIKSLNYPTVKYLKFIIRRPTITFIEQQSILNGKSFQNLSFSLSFLSIIGFNFNRIPNNLLQINHNIQKDMALRVIGKLCDPSYTDTLNILANNQDVVLKIKANFEMMQNILNNYKNWLVPVFLAIATHNPVMGDWLTLRFLDFKRGESHSKLLLDILLISPQYSFHRIKMVYQAILQTEQNLVFVDTFCSAVRMLEIQEKLDFGKKEINIIISYFNQNNSQQITKFLVTLIYYQFNFDLLQYTLSILWDFYSQQKKIDYLPLLGCLTIGCDKGLDWLSKEKMETILQKIIKVLQNYSPKKHKKLNNLLYFLSCIILSKNPELNNLIIKYHLEIYQAVKNQKNNDLKDLEIINYQLIFKILKDLVLGNISLQEEFIKHLIEDLASLNNKKVVTFAEYFLVPFLNASEDIPVCFHPYYLELKRYAYQGFLYTNQSKEKDLFPSKIFSKKEKELFVDAIKPITDKIFNNKKYQLNLILEQFNGKQNEKIEDISIKIQKQLLQNAPFLIILEGSNGKKPCNMGVFCTQNMLDVSDNSQSNDSYYNIPYSENCFLFYSQNDQIHYFHLNYLESEVSHFGFFAIYQDQNISLGFNEAIFINFEQLNQTTVEYESSQFKMLNIGKPATNDMPEVINDFVVKKIEYWSLKQIQQENQQSQNFTLQNFFNKKAQHNPQSYYRDSPVMFLPADMKVKDISFNILNKKHQYIIQGQEVDENIKLIDLYQKYNQNNILDICFNIDKNNSEQKNEEIQYQVVSLFENFQKQGGVQKLIEVLLKCLTQWKNKDRSQKWFMWVKEIASFSELDSFFSLFIKKKDCIDLLFKILSQEPDLESDKEKIKKWQEEEQKAVKFSYNILAQVFLYENSSKIRMQALEKQIIQSIFDRLAYISKESQRKWVDDNLIVDKIVVKENIDQEQKKVVQKKQGVGYGSDNTGQNQRWNVTEYQKEVALKNDQIQQLLQILENFFNFESWEPPSTIIDMVLQSCLLPMIESDFRSSSLLEMSKYSAIYNQELNIVRLFSQNKSLVPFLKKIDDHYQPKQIESIYDLLKKLKDLADIFLKVHQTAQRQDVKEKDDVLILAENIISTLQIVEKCFQSQDIQQEYANILQLPLDQKYRILLKDLRFDYMNMKGANGSYNHHYQTFIKSNQTPPQSKIIRLAQEFADISTSLPIEYTNSIFVRCDENRVDVLKALIMGASETPYAHGAYEFDIYFEDTYPNTPPKVNLTTTGQGKVRFNPNLYTCGKVCLSLLGTWRGNASENWDPKLSTLLQVLVSIQAIIMSDDVYFNEPGFEGEAGTTEGQDKNEAYCNIVRYCNVSYAMIDQITNPSKGFETIIRRHFYLKKDEILAEVRKWLELSETKNAYYCGLIKDHNSNWCGKFKEKGSYSLMLKQAYSKLKTELDNIEPPSILQIQSKQENIQQQDNKIQQKQKILQQANVDYDTNIVNKELDFEDEQVKDRWSRNIGVMGIEALKKQAKAQVFLFNISGLGIEIAKNIVLSGVKRLTIFDNNLAQISDLNGQFFIQEKDLHTLRTKCLQKIQHLNNYVKVDCIDQSDLPKVFDDLNLLKLKEYDVVVLTETDLQLNILVNNYCREHKIKFISCDVYGVFSRVFCDFGDQFEVLDKNGEECNEMIIKNITNENQGIVQLLQGQKLNLEDGDEIAIYNVEGMEKNIIVDKTIQTNDKQENSINNTIHKIKVINKDSFFIGDTTQYGAYQRQGLCKQIKTPLKIDYISLEKFLQQKEVQFDSNLQYHDFEKPQNQIILHCCFLALNKFKQQKNRLPIAWDEQDFKLFNQIIIIYMQDYKVEIDEKIQLLIEQFGFTCSGQFPPLQAFIGGFVAQEIIKAITNKFTPLNQLFYSDCVEVLCDKQEIDDTEKRFQQLSVCLGQKLLEQIRHMNIFMVGVGALGCELLKNFAMLNIGCGEENLQKQLIKGKITITDPDIIELSNLNRQFLFREKHLRMSKSMVGCAAAIQMNNLLKDHIEALQDKVFEGTNHIFTDNFFEQQNVVCNALDNVQARRYMDMRCVSSKIPLLESGTLGPKGHVQVIIPYQTESYGSMNDPQDEGDIPQCTLKMFPEEAVHCVEWALDKFGSLFTLKPKSLIKALDENSQLEGKQLKQAISMIKKRPNNFDDCIIYARNKFQKYFNNNIQQLMFTYPLDCKTKDGSLFWSLPKRPPQQIQFDPQNKIHRDMIASMALLRAKIYSIQLPQNPRSEETKIQIAQKALQTIIQDFKPSADKSKSIQEQADNKQQLIVQNDQIFSEELKSLILQIKDIKINAEEFEKDDDSNFHIDFIYGLSGCRCINYNLQLMEWINVKLKAGRIVPALATTTACIAAIQTIELVKVIKKCKKELMKNAFLNLAVPLLQLTEPGNTPKFKIKEGLEVTIWDVWQITIQKQDPLQLVLDQLSDKYKLIPNDVFYKSKLILMKSLSNTEQAIQTLKQPLIQSLGPNFNDQFCDLTITFKLDPEQEILKNTPIVRIQFE